MKDAAAPDLSDYLAPIADACAGEGDMALRFDASPLVLLAVIGNRYSRMSAQWVQQRHGTSQMVWRILGVLASHPGIPVAQATEITGIDKAAVSRTLAAMAQDGLVQADTPGADPRRKTWQLTKAGYDRHREMLETSLDLHRALLSGMRDDEIGALRALLTKVLSNLKDTAAT